MRGLKQLPEQHPSAVSPLVQAGQLPILYPILQISLKPFSQLGPALSLFPFQHDIDKKPRASSALQQENLPGGSCRAQPALASRDSMSSEVFSTPVIQPL